MLLSQLNYPRYVGMEGLSKAAIFRQLIILGHLVCKFLSAKSSLLPLLHVPSPAHSLAVGLAAQLWEGGM